MCKHTYVLRRIFSPAYRPSISSSGKLRAVNIPRATILGMRESGRHLCGRHGVCADVCVSPRVTRPAKARRAPVDELSEPLHSTPRAEKKKHMSWADASEGIFTSAYGNSGAYRQSVLPDEHYRGDNAEVEFLKREVLDLERVIKSLHSSRTEDRYALEEADQRAAAIDAEAQQWRAAHECKLHEAQEALRGVRAEHAAAIAAAAAREAETRMLTVELRLLCVELFDAETEREAARESEASALSIARSYRGFAAQGAGRLEEMRAGIEDVQARLQQRLAGYQLAAQHALRLRALRAACGWRAARRLQCALSRWMLLVFTAEQREEVQARLEAAYRYRDLEEAQQRVQQTNERQRERDAAESRVRQVEAEAKEARKERDQALSAAGLAASKQAAAEKAAADLQEQLANAERQTQLVRQSSAADLAAAREQLAATRRDVVAASAPIVAAREETEAVEAELSRCRVMLREQSESIESLRAELAAEREARDEESRTRLFLERVLKDERVRQRRLFLVAPFQMLCSSPHLTFTATVASRYTHSSALTRQNDWQRWPRTTKRSGTACSG